MKKISVKIDKNLHGREIKYLLHNHLGMSASVVKKLKNTPEGIMLDGERVFVTQEVRCGQELELNLCDNCSQNIEPREIPLDIVYEDEDIIVLNKQRSMPTHPSQRHYYDTLANGVMHYFKDRSFTFRAITRLDRDTSGLVLVAKNAFAAQLLNGEMRNKKIYKEYVAVVNGTPSPERGRISMPIKRVGNSTILRYVAPDGKEAITDYEVVKTNNDISLVRLSPITGRTHQLRVHMSYIGTPIYGDDMYGAKQTDEQTRLHCISLSFIHPISRKKLTLNAPLPRDIEELFK